MSKSISPTYYVGHPDGSYSVAEPQPIRRPSDEERGEARTNVAAFLEVLGKAWPTHPDILATNVTEGAEKTLRLSDLRALVAESETSTQDDALNFERLAEAAPPGDVVRVLKINTADRQVFYSRDWTPPLVEALAVQANKRHGGVTRMELILMRLADYNAIPATNASAELFAL